MDAALIAPKKEDSVILDELEYETVAAALKLARSESKEAQALACAIRQCQHRKLYGSEEDRYPILRTLLAEVMETLGEHVEEIKGMICLWDDHPTILYEDSGQR